MCIHISDYALVSDMTCEYGGNIASMCMSGGGGGGSTCVCCVYTCSLSTND